jgi:ParB-like chromosome segregation protein Spo0J
MTARGIRNNNPGNLRHGEPWVGLEPQQTDGEFCQFVDMAHGIRALVKNLISYRERHGLNTVREIITRWAPASDGNDTDAYVAAVCKPAGLNPDHPLAKDRLTYEYLARQIARHENGRDVEFITREDWQAGLDLALGGYNERETTADVGATRPSTTETGTPTSPAITAEEKSMVPAVLAKPFIIAAAQAIFEAVPWLMRKLNPDSKTGERNAEIIEAVAPVVVDLAKQATGAVNEQALVEQLKTVPDAPELVSKALTDNWFQVSAEAEKSVASAREFVMAYQSAKDVRTVVGHFTFIELLALYLVTMSSLGAGFVLYGNFSNDLKATVVTMVIVGGFVGIKEFFFGSSRDSQRKTEFIMDERQRREQ